MVPSTNKLQEKNKERYRGICILKGTDEAYQPVYGPYLDSALILKKKKKTKGKFKLCGHLMVLENDC